MSSPFSKLKNVTLRHTMTRGGDDTWMLIHDDGWRDPYFDYYATYLLDIKRRKFNTREKYCRAAAGFIDYLLEAAKWYREGGHSKFLVDEYGQAGSAGPAKDLAGPALVEFIRIYPKVLSGGLHSRDQVVVELAQRLNRRVCAHQSQRLHIEAINQYLTLSESFALRMHQSGLSEVNGLPLIAESSLFPHVGTSVELTRFERLALTNRSMLGGVVAGGPRLKRLAALSPAVVDDVDGDHYDYDSAFPLESAPDLINKGFTSYRDKAFYCLLMAIGIRISEALPLTWSDVDCVNRQIFIRDPRKKDLEKVYLGYLTVEERNKLPWKGRTHPRTLLIEPFATEFWRLLDLYLSREAFMTANHPFVFQVLKGANAGEPLVLSDQSNMRKAFKSACRRIGIDDCYGAHALRHMYAVYCLNYWPNANGTYGLAPEMVQFLLGHTHRDSTMNYAKPDTLILEAEQRVNAAILSGFHIEDRANIRVKKLEEMLAKAMAEAHNVKSLLTGNWEEPC